MLAEDTTAPFMRERRFLLRDLPAGIHRASRHWQLTDNYLTGTAGLSLRFMRLPETNERRYALRRVSRDDGADLSRIRVAEFPLTVEEHNQLLALQNREVRFNQYLLTIAEQEYTIEMYLGPLLNLFLARTGVDENSFERNAPPFAVAEVTDDEMFLGESLARLTAADLRAELSRRRVTKTSADES
ncbi:MAG TPA: hypothetical protein VM870_11240 [Pyrinomonadaceae bacterium]|nr:hypothetical protein [Pyrinomonadaceae bacterium]